MNELSVKIKHPHFIGKTSSVFTVKIDNIYVSVAFGNDEAELKFIGRKGKEKLSSLSVEVLSIIFIYMGSFPKIEAMRYNQEVLDASALSWKYFTDNYFRKRTSVLCQIDAAHINQTAVNNYRRIRKYPLYSMQSLISEAYTHTMTNHRILLLLHVIDGLVEDNQVASCPSEIMKKYKVSVRSCDYICKLYLLCNKYFFSYHRKYNLDILSLMHISQYKYLRILTDTRNWYSHFLADKKKPDRLINGSEMLISFEIVYLIVRLYLIDKLSVPVDEERVKEFYLVLHDWIVDLNSMDRKKYKSKTYKNNVAIEEMNHMLRLIAKKQAEEIAILS